MKTNFIILIILVSIAFGFSSCNAVKLVPENEYLLTGNTVYVNGKKNVKYEITDYIVQRPNESVLGLPLQLYIYNRADENFETDFEQWKADNPKKYNFIAGIFSDKQARGYRNFKYRANQNSIKNGEAPTILDHVKTKQTIDNLTQHFFNEGYFNAKVTSEDVLLKKKKAKVNYFIETRERYIIDSIKTNIESKILDSIYKNSKQNSVLKVNEPFKLSSFIEEQNRITELFRNSGVYRFNKNAITFEADSINNKSKIELLVNDSIANFPFKVQRIKKINIYTDYSFDTKEDPIIDSVFYKGYSFYSQKELRYNPKYFLNYIFIEPNSLYQDEARELTRKSFRNLNNFRGVDIKYTELDDDNLEASIYLTPLKKYGVGFNTELTHSNVSQLGITGKVSFLNKNIFKGGEILKLSILGSFLDSKDAADTNNRLLNAWEIGADVSIEFPRFLTPFNQERIVSKGKTPRTLFTLGTSLQKNVGLDKQKFTGILDYNWVGSKKVKHSVEIFNVQLVKNLNPDQYFKVYTYDYGEIKAIQEAYFPDYILTPYNAIDFIKQEITPEFEATNPLEYETAKNIEARYYIITEDNFIPLLAYTFTYNNRENYEDNDFSFFRARIATSGNVFNAIIKQVDSNNVKTFFNTPVAQYTRLDLEYKKFWSIALENTIAFRAFIGVAIPYGNSSTIPFTRSYFIGGPNDLRAWKTYDLGLGSTNNGLDYNVGNLKLLTSLEYRFNLLNSFKGAIFADAGNIWDLSNSSLVSPEAKFKNLASLKSIALGSGFGIRYDLSFILIRLDLGFKTYEPYLKDGEKWFKNYNFGSAVYNFGISYPF
ncbi:BamA/TamA family outer membrane protein [Lutibacter sp. HS1-25]|uniref:translocation and assembly module lipoprotein TamL n=1 Tax=Lutibacter sp. HS1-25 TaxID=2485000 RepID=UPI0013E9690A|nr:BamA/TamA family outer membrane protein [Lutibacter sp. HS1-25]